MVSYLCDFFQKVSSCRLRAVHLYIKSGTPLFGHKPPCKSGRSFLFFTAIIWKEIESGLRIRSNGKQTRPHSGYEFFVLIFNIFKRRWKIVEKCGTGCRRVLFRPGSCVSPGGSVRTGAVAIVSRCAEWRQFEIVSGYRCYFSNLIIIKAFNNIYN